MRALPKCIPYNLNASHTEMCSCNAVNCRKVLKMAIHGGAKNLGRDDIGQIAPGFAADFVGWKTNTIGAPASLPKWPAMRADCLD